MPQDEAPLDGRSEYWLLVANGRSELAARTDEQQDRWEIGRCDWSVDQDEGTIVFKHPDGLTATAPVQIIGTYNTKDRTWLWAWDHPSVVPALRKDAEKLKAYGEKHKLPKLTTQIGRASCRERVS
jgi:hypothetical protein